MLSRMCADPQLYALRLFQPQVDYEADLLHPCEVGFH
jgi:hypothetical protein